MTGIGGMRFNDGKRKWGLLSWPALAELVKVLEFGAKKYASWNWSDGLSWSECFESMQRHATAWYCGEDRDPETGLSHMAHVMCNALFLTHFILFGTGKDDRPQALNNKKEQDDGAKQPTVYEVRNGLLYRTSDGSLLGAASTYGIHDPVVVSGVPDLQADVRAEGVRDLFGGWRD